MEDIQVSYDTGESIPMDLMESSAEDAQEAVEVLMAEPRNISEASESSRPEQRNSSGYIFFSSHSSRCKKVPYNRLDYKTPPNYVYKLMLDNIKSKSPKLVVSVRGSKENVILKPDQAKTLRNGIIGTAKAVDALIFTEGTNKGVGSLIGNSIISESSVRLRSEKVCIVGIASWGVVQNREEMIGENVEVRTHLPDLNDRHTYHLLPDDGNIGLHGSAEELRMSLERYIFEMSLEASTHPIPVVCLVVGGKSDVIDTVLEYVTGSPPIPVVVMKGSGGAADLFAYVAEHAVKTNDSWNIGILDDKRQQLLFEIKKTFEISEDSKAERVLADLLKCVEKKNFLKSFAKIEEKDLELVDVILRAPFWCGHLSFSQELRLALAWDRVDIICSSENDLLRYMYEEATDQVLEEMMWIALKNNQVDFVRLLLERPVKIDILKCLPRERLVELYNSKEIPTELLNYLMFKIRKPKWKAFVFYFSTYNARLNCDKKFTYEQIVFLLENLMGFHLKSSYMRTDESSRLGVDHESQPIFDETSIRYPQSINELFFWALVNHRPSLANLFLSYGEEPLPKALTAIKIYKKMINLIEKDYKMEVEYIDPIHTSLKKFEEVSLKLLDEAYQRDKICAQILLTCKRTCFGSTSCLDLAVEAYHLNFVAHPTSQLVLDNNWKGLMPIEDLPFISKPIVKFWLWFISYLIFIFNFTSVMLVKLPSLPGLMELYVAMQMAVSGVELVLLICKRPSRPLTYLWSILWDAVDILFIAIFFIGLIFRIVDGYLDYGQNIYWFVIVYWYLRILLFFRVSRRYGPQLITIWKMMKEMAGVYLLVTPILLIRGIALVDRDTKVSLWTTLKTFLSPFFTTFGQNSSSFNIPYGNQTSEANKPFLYILFFLSGTANFFFSFSVFLVTIFLGIMFVSTYNSVETISRTLWKFNRYFVISEYEKKSSLPPPFTLLEYLLQFGKWYGKLGESQSRREANSRVGVISEEKFEDILDSEEEYMETLLCRNEKSQQRND